MDEEGEGLCVRIAPPDRRSRLRETIEAAKKQAIRSMLSSTPGRVTCLGGGGVRGSLRGSEGGCEIERGVAERRKCSWPPAQS